MNSIQDASGASRASTRGWAWRAASLALVSLATACGGGSSGGAGSTDQGLGTSSSSLRYRVSAIDASTLCPNGGSRIDAGFDGNRNGTLEGTEVSSSQVVCSSTGASRGKPGFDALVSVVPEAPDAACAAGGFTLSAGEDTNRNHVLDPTEVVSVSHVCNGTNGSNGQNGLNSLINLVPEPEGDHCQYGGTLVQAGLDINTNGVLDTNEITGTSYVCNGRPSTVYAPPPGCGTAPLTWSGAMPISVTILPLDPFFNGPEAIYQGDLVELSGAASLRDPNTCDSLSVTPDTYLWAFAATAAGAHPVLTSTPTFATAEFDQPGAYLVELYAIDNLGNTSPVVFQQLVVSSCGAQTPQANVDSNVIDDLVGTTHPLVAQASSPDNDPSACPSRFHKTFTYDWSVVDGPLQGDLQILQVAGGTPVVDLGTVPGHYQLQVVAVDSTGLRSAPVLVDVFVRALTWTPGAVDFPNATVGDTDTAAVRLRNLSSRAVTINAITFAQSGSDWQATNDCPAVLAAQQSCTVQVAFSPSSSGSQSGTVTVSDSAGPDIVLTLTGSTN